VSTPDQFHALMQAATRLVADEPLDAGLQAKLNREAGPTSALYQQIFAACKQGVADGWMCNREGGGIRYGRVFNDAGKPRRAYRTLPKIRIPQESAYGSAGP
jgi:hypothetical protein